MKYLCRYTIEMRRSSDISGVFVLTEDEHNQLKELEGVDINFGEISGKHSEVHVEFENDDIEVVSILPEEIDWFEKLFPDGVGFNFKYYWFNRESDND